MFCIKLVLCLVFQQCLRKLIRAGGWTAIAGYALQALDCLIDIHTLYQSCNTLQVTVASTNKAHVCKFAVDYVKIYLSATRSVCFVTVHSIPLFCCFAIFTMIIHQRRRLVKHKYPTPLPLVLFYSKNGRTFSAQQTMSSTQPIASQ